MNDASQMIHSAKELLGSRIEAADGRIGHAADFLMDDFAWVVRYLVVDTGFLLPGREVIISPEAIVRADPDEHAVVLDITTEQIRTSPGVDADMPLSRRAQLDIAQHYGWRPYWETASLNPVLGRSIEAEAAVATRRRVEGLETSNLRSLKEVSGYHIEASDKRLGHAEDFLLDAAHWLVRYLVIDTRNWLPGRSVLVSPQWIEKLVWADRKIHVALPARQIAESPEYDPGQSLSREFEQRLYAHYGKAPYWQREDADATG